MATLYPFSSVTAQRLEAPPAEGETHRWLAQIAAGLSGTLSAELCFEYLRRCCDEYVVHREVPDREIAAAVEFAYGQAGGGMNFGRRALDWPAPNEEVIGKVLRDIEPLFDGEISTGLQPRDVLPHLFAQGELVCTGVSSDRALVRPLETVLADAELQQFVVVNPMRGPWGKNQRGERSARCQSNVGPRRHLVAEFDDQRLTKPMQARLATALGDLVPLVMAVDSGHKSVHAWYRVDGMGARDQARFFAVACLLGADRSRWDPCGWLRMPGGLRSVDGRPTIRQRILYWIEP